MPTPFSRTSFVAALLLSGGAAVAQPALPLQLDMDHAAFLYDEDDSLLEVYFSFGAASLTYEPDDDGFVAEVPLQVVLRPTAANAPAGANVEPVFEERIEFEFGIADTSALRSGQYFVQQVRAEVPPGEYTLDAIVPADAETARGELRLSQDIVVPDFAQQGRILLSDVTLASGIQRAEDDDDPFYKNGLQVVPNPNAIYGEGLRSVRYYAEAYGLSSRPGTQYTLLEYVSEGNESAPLLGFQRRTSRPVRDPDVLVGSIDVSTLPSGSYFLRLALLDENNEALAEQSQKFFVLNPSVARPQVAMENDYETLTYAVMGEEELEENLRHARLIATTREQQVLSRLTTAEEKREFLAEFWRGRDTDSDPNTNSARREFYQRLEYVEEHYRTPYGPAYESDRGRVYLKYGPPSAVDPRTFERGGLVPHEIWEYNHIPNEGEATFIFADVERIGRFELVHSDVTGEISQPDWERRLQQ